MSDDRQKLSEYKRVQTLRGEKWDTEQYRECLRKNFYQTESEASMVASQHSKPWKPMTAYRCRFCPGWHIGTPPRSDYT
jgi:hypothetical protein